MFEFYKSWLLSRKLKTKRDIHPTLYLTITTTTVLRTDKNVKAFSTPVTFPYEYLHVVPNAFSSNPKSSHRKRNTFSHPENYGFYIYSFCRFTFPLLLGLWGSRRNETLSGSPLRFRCSRWRTSQTVSRSTTTNLLREGVELQTQDTNGRFLVTTPYDPTYVRAVGWCHKRKNFSQ